MSEDIFLQTPLLPRIADGDPKAIDECIARYGSLVWSLARRLSSSMTDAEDAVQEIFIDIWKNADRFREDRAGEATFVATLARRRLIDRLRVSSRQVSSQTIDEKNFPIAGPLQTQPVELAEESSRAADCLLGLRSIERSVLELAIYEGLSQGRIAEITGLALGTVKTHARRGLLQLRACMNSRASRLAKEVEMK